VEADSLRRLFQLGVVVIASGGGGIPVVADEAGQLRSVEAVIDKDRSAALLAQALHADVLLIATSVPQVALNYGQANQLWLDHLTTHEAEIYLQSGQHFAAGSMAPKIEAALDFVTHGGHEAIITSPDKMVSALYGQAGTRIWVKE
jgi:carbamate kinase